MNVTDKNKKMNHFNQSNSNWLRKCNYKSITTNEKLQIHDVDCPSVSSSMLKECITSLQAGIKLPSSPELGGKFFSNNDCSVEKQKCLPLEHYVYNSMQKQSAVSKSLNVEYNSEVSPMNEVSKDLFDYSIPTVEINPGNACNSISTEFLVNNPKHIDQVLQSPKNCVQEREISPMNTSFERLIKQHDSLTNAPYNTEYINSFLKMSIMWKKERQGTLKKLQDLKNLLHNDQLFYNKAKRLCLKANNFSRTVKERENSSITNILTFLATFISDAADGATSVVQACNIDGYLTTFKIIMKKDEEATKQLYSSRSACLKQYEDVEEIRKCFYSDNLNDTLLKISDSLELDKFWNSLEKSQDRASFNIFTTVECIISKYCNQEVMNVISTSLLEYVSSNPAALAVCKSAARTMYNVLDFGLGKSEKKDNAKECVSSFRNQDLMLQNDMELAFLEHIIQHGEPQAKLESKLEDAIDSLQFEMEEITLLMSKLESYITE